MKKEVFKRLSEKLKTDKKTRAAVITSAVGAVLVLTAAVTIPVALHNRVKVEADAESAAITAEAVVTESASVVVTEPETEAVSEISTEPTTADTAETTAQAASKNADAGKNTPVDTNKGGSADKNGGSDSSAKKPNSGSNGGQAQQKPPVQNETPVQSNKKQWTQAEVDAIVAEMKQYGINKGLFVNSNKGVQGTSWRTPATTENAQSKSEITSRLTYLINKVYDEAIQDFGYCPEGYTFNVVAKQYTANDGCIAWEIYVVC